MFAIAFVLLIALFNFGIGFCLAVHLGHGPPGVQLPSPTALRRRLQRSAGHSATVASSRHGAH